MSARTREKDERNWAIYWRYMTGDRLAELARAFDLTTERVRQIVARQWHRRRALRRRQERDFLYAMGLDFVYLREREQQRGRVHTYRVRHGASMRVQDWS